MSTNACMRCAVLAPLASLGWLWLCPPCYAAGITPACGDFQHAYVGGHSMWICLRCGASLTSTPVRTGVVEAPSAPVTDWYC